MAVKQIDENFCPYRKDFVKDFLVDTDADFENLPTNVCVGSTAVSIESGTVKIVNTSGEWVTFGGEQ